MVRLLLVAVVGVMLIIDGVIPIVPSSLPSSSIPSVNSPPSTSSPSGIYGYGNKYRVNLHEFQTPIRIPLTSSAPASFVFAKGLMKMREHGIRTDQLTAKIDDAVVDKYEALDGGNKVFKIQHSLEARGIKKYDCVTFGYFHQQSRSVAMIDVACTPL